MMQLPDSHHNYSNIDSQQSPIPYMRNFEQKSKSNKICHYQDLAYFIQILTQDILRKENKTKILCE